MDYPSLLCVSQALARLKADDGFNSLLKTACDAINATYPMFEYVDAFEIDFAGDSGTNFFLGAYAIDELRASGYAQTPCMILYARGAEERQHQKFQVFSGYVTVMVDVHLSWSGEKPRKNAESLGCAVEAALIHLFNRDQVLASGQHNLNWTPPLAYNGEVQITRGEVMSETGGWGQLIRASLLIGVNVPQ